MPFEDNAKQQLPHDVWALYIDTYNLITYRYSLFQPEIGDEIVSALGGPKVRPLPHCWRTAAQSAVPGHEGTQDMATGSQEEGGHMHGGTKRQRRPKIGVDLSLDELNAIRRIQRAT